MKYKEQVLPLDMHRVKQASVLSVVPAVKTAKALYSKHHEAAEENSSHGSNGAVARQSWPPTVSETEDSHESRGNPTCGAKGQLPGPSQPNPALLWKGVGVLNKGCGKVLPMLLQKNGNKAD